MCKGIYGAEELCGCGFGKYFCCLGRVGVGGVGVVAVGGCGLGLGLVAGYLGEIANTGAEEQVGKLGNGGNWRVYL